MFQYRIYINLHVQQDITELLIGYQVIDSVYFYEESITHFWIEIFEICYLLIVNRFYSTLANFDNWVT